MVDISVINRDYRPITGGHHLVGHDPSATLLTCYAFEATRAKIQALQAELGAASGVDPGTGWSGLGFYRLLWVSLLHHLFRISMYAGFQV